MDDLTGFLSRQKCILEAERLTALALEHGSSLYALWVSLNRFREVNTSFGHQAGDEVLLELANRLKAQACPHYRIGRIGADEFIILLPGATQAKAASVAKQIHTHLRAPLRVGQVNWRQTCSIGMAKLGMESSSSLLERADLAMQEAKQAGGGQTTVIAPNVESNNTTTKQKRQELNIEEKLHEAIELNGFSLHYQPIINVADNSIEACEALMRCRVHEQLLAPDQFIPVAEKTGLIVELGDWTLLTAVHMAERLMASGRPTKIAVNISRAQLTAPKFQQTLHALFAISSVPPALIELELTESLFMDSSTPVRRNLDAAVEAGLSLSIDDFGTGYSCLAYLKDIPAKKLKMDRLFVSNLPEDRKSLAIIRAITQLAQDLGMTVVAEGVETPAQRDTLISAGVNALQGFLFTRPLPDTLLEGWLNRFKAIKV